MLVRLIKPRDSRIRVGAITFFFAAGERRSLGEVRLGSPHGFQKRSPSPQGLRKRASATSSSQQGGANPPLIFLFDVVENSFLRPNLHGAGLSKEASPWPNAKLSCRGQPTIAAIIV